MPNRPSACADPRRMRGGSCMKMTQHTTLPYKIHRVHHGAHKRSATSYPRPAHKSQVTIMRCGRFSRQPSAPRRSYIYIGPKNIGSVQAQFHDRRRGREPGRAPAAASATLTIVHSPYRIACCCWRWSPVRSDSCSQFGRAIHTIATLQLRDSSDWSPRARGRGRGSLGRGGAVYCEV